MNQDYSEWFLGHSKSPYYTLKEPERREIFASRVMKYLTFLDFSTLETTGKNIEARLQEKDKEIQHLKQKNTEDINSLRQELMEQQKLQDEKINRLLSGIVKEGIDGKTAIDKEVFEYLIKDPEKNRLFFSTVDCNYNDEVIFDAPAKSILPVRKVLEEAANNRAATGAVSGSS
jgi:hypothetical protein